MKIGEIKNKLAEYDDDIEIYAAPIILMPVINSTKKSAQRNADILNKHKIETFQVLQSSPAPGFEGPAQIFAIFGFNEDNEDILEDDFSIDSKAIN
jgi:hypothetical protein